MLKLLVRPSGLEANVVSTGPSAAAVLLHDFASAQSSVNCRAPIDRYYLFLKKNYLNIIGKGRKPLTCRYTHTHTHLFNGPFSGTTQVSRYQKKVKPIWILLKQETVSGSGISWAICKSAPRSRQITTPAPHPHSVFYRLDALPAAQPTASKH